jgi:NTE family protein
MMNNNKPTLGLALSGGGARGIAHIGVIQALLEHGYQPDVLAGTSAGAIVGSLFAAGMTPEEILKIAKKASIFKLITVSLPYSGLTKLTYLNDLLAAHIKTDNFSALNKEMYIAIANLNTGALEIRSRGELFKVVMASSSIPLVFQPVEIEGQFYVDGGILNNLPAEALNGKADIIIGVNVMPHVEVGKKAINNVFGIAQRCFDLSILANIQPQIALCDIFIEPKAIREFNIFQLNRYKQLYDIGYAAMEEKLPALDYLYKQKLKEGA